jgi:hypothetical protein
MRLTKCSIEVGKVFYIFYLVSLRRLMREINISNISAILISAVYSEHQADFRMRNRVVICIIMEHLPAASSSRNMLAA